MHICKYLFTNCPHTFFKSSALISLVIATLLQLFHHRLLIFWRLVVSIIFRILWFDDYLTLGKCLFQSLESIFLELYVVFFCFQLKSLVFLSLFNGEISFPTHFFRHFTFTYRLYSTYFLFLYCCFWNIGNFYLFLERMCSSFN